MYFIFLRDFNESKIKTLMIGEEENYNTRCIVIMQIDEMKNKNKQKGYVLKRNFIFIEITTLLSCYCAQCCYAVEFCGDFRTLPSRRVTEKNKNKFVP
jgi:hypothetical protein